MSEITIIHEKPPCEKERLYNHIYALKDIMMPPLAGRVDLDIYMEKIYKHADLFYAMDGDAICGSCAVYMNQKNAYITSIGVFPDYWRRGIGTKLLQEVMRVGMMYQIEDISLKVFKRNEKAIKFYEASGFAIEVINNDWITMRKKLEVT